MATIQMTQASERWIDEVILIGSKTDIDAVQSDEYLLPAGLGDVAIMSVDVQVVSIDVLSTTANIGVNARVVSGDGTGWVIDLVGTAPFYTMTNTTNALGIAAFIDPDAMCLWRQGERLQLVYGEIDTDATPTADVHVRVKCVRVRTQYGVSRDERPLQLVRAG